MATWYIDTAHSSVAFGVKHMMVSTVRGRFGVRGRLEFDRAAPELTELDVSIDVTTIDTGEPRRDAHLRSADFFDVERYPTITFRSTNVEHVGADRYRVSGELTVRGVTRAVSFDAELDGIAVDRQGGRHLGASASLAIDRKDFGLTWNQPIADGVLVGDTVKIELALAAIDFDTAKRLGLAA